MYAQTLKGASPGDFVVITITDTGGGIPPEIIDRIFDPFFTTKEPGRGTGLGLFTVQGIVTSHGGSITVETQPGRGTKFKIYLPAHEATSLKQVEERYLDIPFGNGELILVIDDEAAVREMTGTALETFGYRVMTADNGATALAAFASHKDEISVVITDMMMPVMDGLVDHSRPAKIEPASLSHRQQRPDRTSEEGRTRTTWRQNIFGETVQCGGAAENSGAGAKL